MAIGLLAIVDGIYSSLREVHLVGFTPVETKVLSALMDGFNKAEASASEAFAGQGNEGELEGGGTEWLLTRLSAAVRNAHNEAVAVASPLKQAGTAEDSLQLMTQASAATSSAGPAVMESLHHGARLAATADSYEAIEGVQSPGIGRETSWTKEGAQWTELSGEPSSPNSRKNRTA